MLNPPLHAEQQQFRTHPGFQVENALRGKGIQPAQPVGAADGDNASVREVHNGVSAGQFTLFAQRIAVVGGDAGIKAAGFHRAVTGQEGAQVSHMECNVLAGAAIPPAFPGEAGQAFFLRMAEAWAVRELPPSATSQRQYRSPLTRPKIRVAAVYSLELTPRMTRSVVSEICGPLIWP